MQVACPALSLTTETFTTAVTAAVNALGGTVSPDVQTFDPYSSTDNFLIGAYIFEDVGVTAYKGAVQNLQVDTGCWPQLWHAVNPLLFANMAGALDNLWLLCAELHVCCSCSWHHGN